MVLRAIPDLKKTDVEDRLQRQIFGIDPGASLMRLSEGAMATYGLEHYNLIRSSGAAMTAMVERPRRRMFGVGPCRKSGALRRR